MFVVACTPMVRARLRRCFPRISMNAAHAVALKATDEVCRDLLWFMERFPLEADAHAAERLQGGAVRHVDREAAVAALIDQRQPMLPFDLALPPRDYQRQAAQLLLTSRNLLLADDVGLGKTCSAICAMPTPEALPALVVCPTHLPRQWAAEIALFAPQLSVHIVTKGSPYPIKWQMRGGVKERATSMPDVLVINYHKLRGWAEQLAGVVRYVVFDEAQQLRGDGTSIWSAARHVAERATLRLGLSATPIYNYGIEFHSVYEVLAPEALGTRDEFSREWCGGNFGEKARVHDPNVFGNYLRGQGLMLRRTRAEVGRELPPLTKVVHEVDADSQTIDAARKSAVELARIVLQATEAFRGQKMQAAGELDALMRQATGVAKAPFVAAFVRLLLESEPRVVLFGWHHAVYGIWREALREYRPVMYTGAESPTQRDAALARFKDPSDEGSRVLIMSLRSGAGVDGLQHACRTVVFGELDWSPGVHEQCAGRVHRDAQGEPVTAYYMCADDGADPIMIEVLGVKRSQLEPVRNPNMPLVERLETGVDNIRRLAVAALARAGEVSAPVPAAPSLFEAEVTV
ncbi:MAG TPA: helicase SNF2 [Gemmatimonas aurantiaca]|nr:helicase SNF2 [Gemmatimonas aurantiaca]